MRIVTSFFLFLLCASKAFPYSYFLPPPEWKLAEGKVLSPRVQIGFIGKGKKYFCPSLNLSTEEVSISLEEYVKVVKNLHEARRASTWRDLGKVRTRSGEARLCSIDTPTEFGPVRILQMMLIKNNTAYVLTGAALKDELSGHYDSFQKAFESFTITPDLYQEISDLTRCEELKKRLGVLCASEESFTSAEFQKNKWAPFQNFVVESFADLGACWQAFFLQMAQEQLLGKKP